MIIVKEIGGEKMEISKGGGYWTKYLQFDNKVLWRRNDII